MQREESNRILTGHVQGDEVAVDWHDGRGPTDLAVVELVEAGPSLWLRFIGETRARRFTPVDVSRGLFMSPRGTTVEVGR